MPCGLSNTLRAEVSSRPGFFNPFFNSLRALLVRLLHFCLPWEAFPPAPCPWALPSPPPSAPEFLYSTALCNSTPEPLHAGAVPRPSEPVRSPSQGTRAGTWRWDLNPWDVHVSTDTLHTGSRELQAHVQVQLQTPGGVWGLPASHIPDTFAHPGFLRGRTSALGIPSGCRHHAGKAQCSQGQAAAEQECGMGMPISFQPLPPAQVAQISMNFLPCTLVCIQRHCQNPVLLWLKSKFGKYLHPRKGCFHHPPKRIKHCRIPNQPFSSCSHQFSAPLIIGYFSCDTS